MKTKTFAAYLLLAIASTHPALGAPVEANRPCSGWTNCPRQPWVNLTEEWRRTAQHALQARVYKTAPPAAGDIANDGFRNGQLQDLDALARVWRHFQDGTHDTQAIFVFGEAHDNPHHHRLRAVLMPTYIRLVQTEEKFNRVPMPFVFEQITADRQQAVDRFFADNDVPGRRPEVAEFYAAIDWKNSGWDRYDYDPIFAAAIEERLPIYAGDPPRDTIRKIAKEGPGVLSDEDQKRLALDQPLGDKLDAVSAKEIEDSHCGMLPTAAIPKMAFAQRYRDAHLADATLKAAADHGQAVLLTGNNHALTDRGVPWYIRARTPDKKVVSIVLVEVEDGKTDPQAYVPRDPDGQPAADYLIFTPSITRDDPCKAFGK